MSGIFIARGMTLALTNFSIRFSKDGKIDSTMEPKVGFDACIPWLEIAIEHLVTARTLTSNSAETWNGTDENAKGELLRHEFLTSMQTIVAAAIAIDAFYSKVDQCLDKKKQSNQKSRRKKLRRAARYATVSETIKVAFGLKPPGASELRKIIKQIFLFRDRAVHPSGALSDPILHPDMKVGVESRFVAFRYENARNIVKATIEMVTQLTNKRNSDNKKLHDYCVYLQKELATLKNEDIF